MRVLVTRPEGDADRSAERLEAAGHEPLVAPLMEIAPVPASLPGGEVQAVVLTSANAAAEIGRRPELARLLAARAFPVGERTARAAREAGFTDVAEASPTGEGHALVEGVAAACRPEGGAILHPAGRDVAVDVAAALADRGFRTHRLVLYEARAVEHLPAEAAEALRQGRVDAVLLYSARSARLLLEIAAREGLSDALAPIAAVAMSEAVAEPLRQAGHSHIAVARDNTEGALFEALRGLAVGGG